MTATTPRDRVSLEKECVCISPRGSRGISLCILVKARQEAELVSLRRELSDVQRINRHLGVGLSLCEELLHVSNDAELSQARKLLQDAERLHHEVERLRVAVQSKDNELKVIPYAVSCLLTPQSSLLVQSVQAERARLLEEAQRLSVVSGQLVAERQVSADLYSSAQLLRQEKVCLCRLIRPSPPVPP